MSLKEPNVAKTVKRFINPGHAKSAQRGDRQQATEMSSHWRLSALIFLAMNLVASADEEAPKLALPTDNTALLRGEPEAFYQVVERNFKGVISYPWQGGQYGFVRDPRELGSAVTYTRFHEGMDIRPMRRDARGEPLDEVRSTIASAAATVACLMAFTTGALPPTPSA